MHTDGTHVFISSAQCTSTRSIYTAGTRIYDHIGARPSPLRPHSIVQKRNFLAGSPGENEQRVKQEECQPAIKMSQRTISLFPAPPAPATGRCYCSRSRFTRQEIESGSAPLAVLVALEVVLVIVVILGDGAPVPVLVAGISRETVAGRTPLGGLSHAGPMIVTKEDRRRRRRRQLRALKATLKISGQERLYRVSLRRAWKTERERDSLS